jgi:hypothetical protein
MSRAEKFFTAVFGIFGVPWLLMMGLALIGVDFGYLKCLGLDNCFGIPLAFAVYTGVTLALKYTEGDASQQIGSDMLSVLMRMKTN